ncbi:MAG TPA: hypothetical protein VFX47_02970 [Gammaproteobacteria bacterium]|nr:hypothetical protein [Gammaproteobacteria bacterium]
MKLALTGSGIVGLALVGVGAVAWWKWDAIKSAFDPTSDKNLAYTGVNNVVKSLSGNPTASLGTWIYDLVHGDAGQQSGNTGTYGTNGGG